MYTGNGYLKVVFKGKHMSKWISIIIPVFNEGINLSENIKYIENTLDKTKYKFEIILIDDGSKDNSWEVIKKLSTENEIINGIKFTRNFGKESAIFAGLKHANGDAAVTIDSDLQHPPEIIMDFLDIWENEEYQIVEGVKDKRAKESFVYKLSSNFFNKIMNKLTGFDFSGASDFKLIDRQVIQYLISLKEKNTFFRGLSTWSGFKTKVVKFSVNERKGGNSKWSLFGLGKLAINAITSFSSAPMHIVTTLGAILLIISIILGTQTIIRKASGFALEGFTTIILLLLFIGSVLMISLGIIGSYISRIYDEIKDRPRYIIAEKNIVD
jgi:glycosyltransferase involved in cell wall biosynthesis